MLVILGAATFLEAFAGVLDGKAILAHCTRNHTTAAYERLLAHPGSRAWVAETAVGRAPVGYALLTRPELPLYDLGEKDVELRRIYLFSRFSSAGIGQALMDQAIAGARAMGGRRLLLGVYRENARALAFYARNGFEQLGVRRFQLGESIYDDLVLGRSL